MPTKPIDPLDSIREVAAGLGVSERTIRNMVADGRLPGPIRIGSRSVRWPRSVWQSFIRRQAFDADQ